MNYSYDDIQDVAPSTSRPLYQARQQTLQPMGVPGSQPIQQIQQVRVVQTNQNGDSTQQG